MMLQILSICLEAYVVQTYIPCMEQPYDKIDKDKCSQRFKNAAMVLAKSIYTKE